MNPDTTVNNLVFSVEAIREWLDGKNPENNPVQNMLEHALDNAQGHVLINNETRTIHIQVKP